MNKRMRPFWNSKGHTLTELMLSLAVFSSLTIAAAGVFDSSQESLNWNYQQLTLQKELRRTVANMIQEIRESSPSSPIPISIGTNTMTIQIPAAVSGNTITSWTAITYGLGADNTVTRTDGSQSTVIGSSVQSMNFVYPLDALTAPRTVQIQITGQRSTLKRTVTETVTDQVTLRNG